MPVKIAINGFGRIGRAAFKIALEKDDLEIVAINDLTNHRVLAHLLKHDTVYGIYEKDVFVEEDGKEVRLNNWQEAEDFYKEGGNEGAGESNLVVAGTRVKVLSQKEPEKLPWGDLEVDVVLECTGRFTKDGAAKAHIEAGAKKVVVSAPTKGEGNIQTFLLGVNHDQYLGQDVISNASCTTNCISPVVAVMHSNFKIKKSIMTTVHAVTATQNLVDGPPQGGKGDMRRARAADYNIIPTTTGAAKATTNAIPELEGLFDGLAIRVPVLVGSISDITMVVEKETTQEEVNKAFIEASENPFYKGVLGVSHVPLVSSDIIKSPYSSIVDLSLTRVIDGDLVKVMAWYDNEWGYSNRLVEMAAHTVG